MVRPGSLIAPVRRSVHVPVTPDIAFARFTAEIGQWWPAATHSVGQGQVAAVVLEPGEGGRLYERLEDGTEHNWGWIRAWEPPHRVVMSWHPGSEGVVETELEVRFVADAGGTKVSLEHRGWEVLADQAQTVRDGYESGWASVLAAYTASLGTAPDTP